MRSARLSAYLSLETAMFTLDNADPENAELADMLRDALEPIWRGFSSPERALLNARGVITQVSDLYRGLSDPPGSIAEDQAVPEFLALVDEKLDHVLAHPGGWGGTETLEPIVLLLSMLRARTLDSTASDQAVLKTYGVFIADRVGKGAGDLRSRLGLNGSVDAMVTVLREFVDSARQRSQLETQEQAT